MIKVNRDLKTGENIKLSIPAEVMNAVKEYGLYKYHTSDDNGSYVVSISSPEVGNNFDINVRCLRSREDMNNVFA